MGIHVDLKLQSEENNRASMFKVGSQAIFAVMPSWAPDLPEESQRVFRFCLGRTYRVAETDHNGLFVLDVSLESTTVSAGL